MTPPRNIPARTQRGAVLIVALLFLTILTILGVTAMTATTFEEKMAGNTRDFGIAFQAAELALRDARRDINSIVVTGPVTQARALPIVGKTGFGDGSDLDNGSCNPIASGAQAGLCRPQSYDPTVNLQPATLSAGVQFTNKVDYGTFTGALPLPNGMFAFRPHYVVEVLCLPQQGASLGDPNYCNFYRITARGYGGNPNTQVTLQEIFLKP
jgi:type IV pilus assembly protein PilX